MPADLTEDSREWLLLAVCLTEDMTLVCPGLRPAAELQSLGDSDSADPRSYQVPATCVRTKILLRELNSHHRYPRLVYLLWTVLTPLQEDAETQELWQLSSGTSCPRLGGGRVWWDFLSLPWWWQAIPLESRKLQNSIQYPPPGWVHLTSVASRLQRNSGFSGQPGLQHMTSS